jgi:hypothetical protein
MPPDEFRLGQSPDHRTSTGLFPSNAGGADSALQAASRLGLGCGRPHIVIGKSRDASAPQDQSRALRLESRVLRPSRPLAVRGIEVDCCRNPQCETFSIAAAAKPSSTAGAQMGSVEIPCPYIDRPIGAPPA